MAKLRHPRVLLGKEPPPKKRQRPVVVGRIIYRQLILRLLLRAVGHELPSREIRATIAQRLANRFTVADIDLLGSGSPRWVINMQWTRKRMVMDGLMEQTVSAGHGKWKLTYEGIREAQALVG